MQETVGIKNMPNSDQLENEELPSEFFTLHALSNTPREAPDLNNHFWTKIKDLFKVQLNAEFVPLDGYDTKVRLVLASGDLPEAMVINTLDDSVFNKAVKQGLFWDLEELAGDFTDFPNLQRSIPDAVWKYTRIEGKSYIIPRIRPILDAGIHWRPDIFGKLELPQPKTLDAYISGLKQVVDANPLKGYIGLHFEESFFNAFGGFEASYNNEGGLVHKYLTDNYTEFIRWYRHVYSLGLMSKEFAVLKGSDKENMFRSDKSLTYIRNMYHSYTYEQDLKRVDTSYKTGVITYLNGPLGHTGEYGTGFTGGFVISKKVPKEKATRILQMYDQAMAPEVTQLLLRGFEGLHYQIVNGERIPLELAKKEMSNAVMQIFPNSEDEWQKVINNAAPQEWNEQMKKNAETLYDAHYAIDPFRVIRSETWLREWPKAQDDYISIRTQAIMGIISMNDYESYVQRLREQPVYKQAFQEFAESYRLMF
ncbi:extracellular solute-binding protein [Paenibacillus agricola]|nr:extracellular solute-binding protein [Paenibacillus agricola]